MQAFGELKLTSPYITGMNASVLRTQLNKKIKDIKKAPEGALI